ncbi:MAG: DUF6390 family protein [Acidimicrobiia bacterium]
MTSGAELFARYAFPPNELGYCGPSDALWSDAVLRTEVEADVAHAAQQFEGAWPYLELIGGLHGLDPLDRMVVEAYWVGNELLDHVDLLAWGNSVSDRFSSRAGSSRRELAEAIPGGRPNHAFHVFCVYPWVGLLHSGQEGPSLEVIDRCRIRAGRVVATDGLSAVVTTRPICWDGRWLSEGPAVPERVRLPVGIDDVHPGAFVTMHWDYVCDAIDANGMQRLAVESARHIALANRSGRRLLVRS